MTDQIVPSPARWQRIISYMVAGVIGLSVIAFFTTIVGTLAGVRDFSEGVWPTIFVLPLVGLPLGFILVVVLIVATAIRRRRLAQQSRSPRDTQK